MANYHVLGGINDGNAFTVVYHVAVPNVNNRVGINVRTALVNSGVGGTTSMTEGNGAGQITTAEKAQVASGALYEFIEVFHTNPGETAGQLQSRIDARYTQLLAAMPTLLTNRLSYFGFTRDVP